MPRVLPRGRQGTVSTLPRPRPGCSGRTHNAGPTRLALRSTGPMPIWVGAGGRGACRRVHQRSGRRRAGRPARRSTHSVRVGVGHGHPSGLRPSRYGSPGPPRTALALHTWPAPEVPRTGGAVAAPPASAEPARHWVDIAANRRRMRRVLGSGPCRSFESWSVWPRDGSPWFLGCIRTGLDATPNPTRRGDGSHSTFLVSPARLPQSAEPC